MQTDLVSLRELSERDRREWAELAGRAVEANPFFEPGMVLPAAGCLATDESPELLVVRDGTSLRACVPVVSVRRGRRFPFPMLKAWRHLYSFLGSPLVDATCADEVIDTLVRGVGRGSPRFLLLEQVGDGVAELLAGLPYAHVIGREERAIATLHDDGPPPLGIKGKHRRELARKGRALCDGFEGELVRCLPLSAEVVERFLTLEASGWKGEAGTALASQHEHARYFRAVCEQLGADGRIDIIEIGHPRAPAAMTCMLYAGQTAFAFKIAVDERRASLSPGVQLMAEVPRVLLRRDECTVVDSCADAEHETVNRLWTERRALTTYLVSVGAVGRAIGSIASRLMVRHEAREPRSPQPATPAPVAERERTAV